MMSWLELLAVSCEVDGRAIFDTGFIAALANRPDVVLDSNCAVIPKFFYVACLFIRYFKFGKAVYSKPVPDRRISIGSI